MRSGMTSHLFALCFDAHDPSRLARFWAGVLGWTATEVTKRAWCDVLIVRPEKDLGELEVPEDAAPE